MHPQVNRAVSKRRVHEIMAVADAACAAFMQRKLGAIVQVLVEENNIGRTPHDIPVKIDGAVIPARTICNIEILDIADGCFIGRAV